LNGGHLHPYSLLQTGLPLLQFSFFNLNEAKKRFFTRFIERDDVAPRLS
jgi:hypothetical protein